MIIKNIELNGATTDIEIVGNRFGRIEQNITPTATQRVIDGTDKAILPPFYNTHTHAAMSLLRGIADDMELYKWLSEHIWPREAKLTSAQIYAGVRLSILEMIKSGTIHFNDMYWDLDVTIKAVKEMGIRAELAVAFIETGDQQIIEDKFALLDRITEDLPEGVTISLAPHAIYTVSPELYKRCKEYCRAKGLRLHTHLAETKKEVDDCIEKWGKTPVELLDSLDILDENTVVAHVVHLSDSDIKTLAKRKVIVAHNPCSNMKLGSGLCNLPKLKAAGCTITIGTDGSASNNNVSMLEEIKFAGLITKLVAEPEAVSAEDIFEMATTEAAKVFGYANGKIETGEVADAVLYDLNCEQLVPNHNLISNIVYSADTRCVDTVICNGRVIMESGRVANQEQIIAEAKAIVLG